MRTLIIAIVIIIVVIILMRRRSTNEVTMASDLGLDQETQDINALNAKISHVVSECGYQANYEIYSHPSKTFTINKHKMYVCTSCAENDRLLYMGLHEVAHVLTSTFHSSEDAHGQVWEGTFRVLLTKADELGYLNPVKINP